MGRPCPKCCSTRLGCWQPSEEVGDCANTRGRWRRPVCTGSLCLFERLAERVWLDWELPWGKKILAPQKTAGGRTQDAPEHERPPRVEAEPSLGGGCAPNPDFWVPQGGTAPPPQLCRDGGTRPMGWLHAKRAQRGSFLGPLAAAGPAAPRIPSLGAAWAQNPFFGHAPPGPLFSAVCSGGAPGLSAILPCRVGRLHAPQVKGGQWGVHRPPEPSREGSGKRPHGFWTASGQVTEPIRLCRAETRLHV